jgi:hypothetical protein
MNEVLQNLGQVISFAQKQPVQGGQLGRDALRLHLVDHHRYQALVVADSVGDFEAADL